MIAKKPISQLDLFEQNLPYRPYCSDEKGWLQIRAKSTAIKKKYIQHNPPSMCAWLVYDYDKSGALDHIGQNHLPTPNLIASNPANGNSHLFYRLADPICTSDFARQKPLSLLAKIDFVLCTELEADPGYQGFISKNLLHSHWIVQEVHSEPWHLADFLEYLDIPKRIPKKAQTQGMGRNSTLFEKGRFWAYREVLSYRLASNQKTFANAVLRHCEGINASFPTPLNFSEVKSVAKSIASWTWKKYTGSVMSDEKWAQYVADTHTPEKQRARQVKQVESRRASTKAIREEVFQLKEQGLTQAQIAQKVGKSQGTISLWLREQPAKALITDIGKLINHAEKC